MGDLGLRVVSAVLVAPVVIIPAWFGGWPFAILLAVTAMLVVREWSGVVRGLRQDGPVIVGAIGAAAAILSVAGAWPGAGLAALIAAAAGAHLLARGNDPLRLMGIGVLYAGVPMLALFVLRADPALGLAALAYVVAIVWATDIGAYFTGRLVGGPKLWPAVSPKKTWSGFAGGLVAGLFAAIAVAASAGLAWVVPAGISLVLSVASQGGDLAESALKRRFDVKDTGNLLPGHGGVMDRIDGLAAAALIAGAIGIARGGPGAAGTGLLLW